MVSLRDDVLVKEHNETGTVTDYDEEDQLVEVEYDNMDGSGWHSFDDLEEL